LFPPLAINQQIAPDSQTLSIVELWSISGFHDAERHALPVSLPTLRSPSSLSAAFDASFSSTSSSSSSPVSSSAAAERTAQLQDHLPLWDAVRAWLVLCEWARRYPQRTPSLLALRHFVLKTVPAQWLDYGVQRRFEALRKSVVAVKDFSSSTQPFLGPVQQLLDALQRAHPTALALSVGATPGTAEAAFASAETLAACVMPPPPPPPPASAAASSRP
jgi:hypothetical protein